MFIVICILDLYLYVEHLCVTDKREWRHGCC